MKRFDTVIAAFARIVDQTDAGLVIVGDGDARSALQAQAKIAGLADRVVFTGKMSNPFSVVRGADVFVIASEYEGFSNSMLEAMLIGIPVIASYYSSDVRDMEQRGAVLGFSVGDDAQLANHLMTILNNAARVSSLRESAFAYAEGHAVGPSIDRYNAMLRTAASMPR